MEQALLGNASEKRRWGKPTEISTFHLVARASQASRQEREAGVGAMRTE